MTIADLQVWQLLLGAYLLWEAGCFISSVTGRSRPTASPARQEPNFDTEPAQRVAPISPELHEFLKPRQSFTKSEQSDHLISIKPVRQARTDISISRDSRLKFSRWDTPVFIASLLPGLLVISYGVAMMVAGLAGLAEAVGVWAAGIAFLLALAGFTLPILVGAFICGVELLDMHWIVALLLVLPGMAFILLSLLGVATVGIGSVLRNIRK